MGKGHDYTGPARWIDSKDAKYGRARALSAEKARRAPESRRRRSGEAGRQRKFENSRRDDDWNDELALWFPWRRSRPREEERPEGEKRRAVLAGLKLIHGPSPRRDCKMHARQYDYALWRTHVGPWDAD